MKYHSPNHSTILAACLNLLLVLLCAHLSSANSLLISTGDNPVKYIATLSGTVGNETFNNAKVMITLMPATYQDIHPYIITVEGYPEDNANYSFFWITRDSDMDVSGNEIVCRLKRNFKAKRPNIFFYYISPVLLEINYVTQREEEAEELAKQTALPTKIFANAGELKLNFTGNRIKGSVKLVGYDQIQNAYTHYQATFVGTAWTDARQKSEKKKNIGVYLIEPERED